MHAHGSERGQDDPLFSLVLPTYNASAFLQRTWRDVSEFMRGQPESWEALFVCDGCTDGTTRQLNELCRQSAGRLRVLAYAPNRGKGHAVRAGLAAARGRWRIFTDVDLAYSFEDILRVAAALRGGEEIAIASRLHPDSRLILPPALLGYAYRRHLQSHVFSRLVRWLLPLTQHDTQAGLKGVSARVAQLILPQLTCAGFGFDCELLTACVRHGLPIAEVPVSVRYEDTVSTTGLTAISRMIRELWEIRRRWRRSLPLADLGRDRRAA